MRAGSRIVLFATALAMLTAGWAEEVTEVGSPSASSTVPSPTESSDVTPTETATPTVTASITHSPSAAPSPELEDGRHFGFIHSVDTDTMTLVFDLAYFLTGEEANEAATEHGDEVPVPNDYYIVNDNPRLRTLELAPALEILLIDWQGDCCNPRTLEQGELQAFADAFLTRHHPYDSLYQGGDFPYWLTVQDGVVTTIEEQYLP